ncbi:MAG: hypothetical protein KIS92_06260 [Planctomycetota bacterium]|nr:hypothetical protein [Planctomycetota bacterium]
MLATANPDLSTLIAKMPPVPKLPPPAGKIVRVATTEELVRAFDALEDGTTLLLADGVYTPPPDLRIRAHGITLRGESGKREAVAIDAGGARVTILSLIGARDCTIADMTFRNSELYGVRIYGDSGVRNTRIHNVLFHNIWTRGLKGTHPQRIMDSGDDLQSPEEMLRKRPTQGLVQHCLFLCDTPKPWPGYHEPDYISGIDMMGLKDWTFADNLFVGIRGQNGGGRGAIFIWVQSEDVIAERNLIVNCDRGVAFGNPSGKFPQVTRGIVRHNRIVAGANKAIEQSGTLDNEVYENLIHSTKWEYERTIAFTEGCKGARCRGNVIHGRIVVTEDSQAELSGNRTGRLEGVFVQPEAGDLNLA